MRKFVLTLVLGLSIVVLAGAQDYKTGLGLRAGSSWGLTLKHFVDKKAAFEGILYGHHYGFNITGLYEVHNQAFDVENLKWYYGFGAHIGSYNYDKENNFVMGIDGILGIEYSFTEAPINIGLDWNPYFNLIGTTEFFAASGALSVRYIF
jgi:hypothetical protein